LGIHYDKFNQTGFLRQHISPAAKQLTMHATSTARLQRACHLYISSYVIPPTKRKRKEIKKAN
jgi:hypothetical protein